LGITVGCLLGMLPLIFFKDSKKEDKDGKGKNKEKEKPSGEEIEPKSEK
jgi:hypothetical protein